MNTTPNYGFLLPDRTDYYSIEAFNENMRMVDDALKSGGASLAGSVLYRCTGATDTQGTPKTE